MSELLTIATATELTETEIDNALQLVADAEAVDHMKALNEAACCGFGVRTRPRDVLVSEDEQLVGYAQLESGPSGAPASSWSLLAIGGEASAPCCCSG